MLPFIGRCLFRPGVTCSRPAAASQWRGQVFGRSLSSAGTVILKGSKPTTVAAPVFLCNSFSHHLNFMFSPAPYKLPGWPLPAWPLCGADLCRAAYGRARRVGAESSVSSPELEMVLGPLGLCHIAVTSSWCGVSSGLRFSECHGGSRRFRRVESEEGKLIPPPTCGASERLCSCSCKMGMNLVSAVGLLKGKGSGSYVICGTR